MSDPAEADLEQKVLLVLLMVLLIVILSLHLVLAGVVHESAALYAELKSPEIDPERYFHRLYDVLPS